MLPVGIWYVPLLIDALFIVFVLNLLHQAEFAHPWSIFAPVFDIVVTSPQGGEAPVDPDSLVAAETDDICATFLRDQEQLWKNTRKLEGIIDEVKDFDAVFYVGGYGRQISLSPLSHNTQTEHQ